MSSRQTLEYLKNIDIRNQLAAFGYVREIASRSSHQRAVSQIIPYLCLSYYYNGEQLSIPAQPYMTRYLRPKVYDRMTIISEPLYKPGQSEDSPIDEFDGAWIFYQSLYKEDQSDFAELWLLEHGCLDDKKTQILCGKYGKNPDTTLRELKMIKTANNKRLNKWHLNLQSYGAISIPSKPMSETIAHWVFKINDMVYMNSICICVISENANGKCGEVYYGVFDSGQVHFNDEFCDCTCNDAQSFKRGDIVTLTLNTTNGTLFYKVNQEMSERLFAGIKQQEKIKYKIGIQLLTLGASVTLLGFHCDNN